MLESSTWHPEPTALQLQLPSANRRILLSGRHSALFLEFLKHCNVLQHFPLYEDITVGGQRQ
jgi:hypothetical protein